MRLNQYHTALGFPIPSLWQLFMWQFILLCWLGGGDFFPYTYTQSWSHETIS